MMAREKLQILLIYFMIWSFTFRFNLTNAEVQRVRFYQSSSSCNSETIREIYESSNNVNSSLFSSMSLLGMWQIWYCLTPNFNCGSPISTYVVNCGPIEFCIGRVANRLYNFRMLGDSYQMAPELYLYSSKDFAGQVVKVTPTGSWSSHSSLVVQSFWFTGSHEWTLFSEANCKGIEICLKPITKVIHQGFGFTSNTTLSKAYNIKSAKYGCNNGTRVEYSFILMGFVLISMIP